MKFLNKFSKAPIRVLKLNRKRAKLRFRWSMISLKQALAQEKQETKEMLNITSGKINIAANFCSTTTYNNIGFFVLY